MKTLFSGIKPTGELHIGNYLGAVRNWVALQKDYSCIYSIVDYHALTTPIEQEELKTNTIRLAADLLSLGIDPKKSILFRQSDVPEHTELAWIFACLTPVPELERMTQYKDFVRDGRATANAGLLTYPVLQTADILLYMAEYVPVGEDQLQHLELGRIIARKFNKRYGSFFPEIQPVLSENVRVMALNDPGKKMSKSLGPKSYIALRDAADVVKQKIQKAVTDSLDSTNSLTGGHNLLTLFKQFGPHERAEHFERAHALKKLSYDELKRDLIRELNGFLEPIRVKRAHYDAHPKEIEKILSTGAKHARVIAQKTLSAVRKKIGLS
ncbi:MAG: tryptophan--tRNA ligase [Patescibacteria group bacterium]